MFGSFLFRDIIQYIMPTVLIISLFLPYFCKTTSADKNIVEIISFSSIVLGYFISTPLSTVAGKLFKILPITKEKIKTHKKMSDWMYDNWDYGKFFYNMPNEDREYVYSTNAYMNFYQLTSFYFLLYGIENIIITLYVIAIRDDCNWFFALHEVETPILFGGSIQTWIVIIISMTLFYSMFNYYLLEYRVLFFPEFQHDQYARKFQRKGLRIAKSVWGKIIREGRLADARVELLISDTHKKYDTVTDEEGFFQFKDRFEECVGHQCQIRVDTGDTTTEEDFAIDVRTVPYFEIRVPAGTR